MSETEEVESARGPVARTLDIACREFGAQWPSAAIVVTRASTWRDDPDGVRSGVGRGCARDATLVGEQRRAE